jgi:hypothetical protein
MVALIFQVLSSGVTPLQSGISLEVRRRRYFVSICMLFPGGYFTILEGAFLVPRLNTTNGGGAGGRSSICVWIAKRSLPIWAMMVEVPGSSGGFGNGNTLFLRFFIKTVMPSRLVKSKSPRSA